MDKEAELRRQAEQAIKDGADPAQVGHRLRSLLAQLKDEEMTPREAPDTRGKLRQGVEETAGAAINAANQVPGMKGLMALARSARPDVTYPEAVQDLDNSMSQVPPVARGLSTGLGAVATAGIPIKSPAIAGGVMGGIGGAADADPDLSFRDRAQRGLFGLAGGAVTGKAFDMAGEVAQAARPRLLGGVGDPAKERLGMLAKRAGSADELYAKALAEGQGKTAPAEVAAFIQDPDIAPIVAELQASRQFAHLDPDSPEMLHEVYKQLSEQAGQARKGLTAMSPTRAQSKRVILGNTKGAQGEMLDAVSGGPDPMMPTYPTAVKTYAQDTKNLEAFDQGFNSLGSAMSPGVRKAENLTRPEKSTTALVDRLGGNVGQSEREATARGLTGATRDAMFRLTNMQNPVNYLVRGVAAPFSAGPMRRAALPNAGRSGLISGDMEKALTALLLSKAQGR